jgi:hypothetical protein
MKTILIILLLFSANIFAQYEPVKSYDTKYMPLAVWDSVWNFAAIGEGTDTLRLNKTKNLYFVDCGTNATGRISIDSSYTENVPFTIMLYANGGAFPNIIINDGLGATYKIFNSTALVDAIAPVEGDYTFTFIKRYNTFYLISKSEENF